MSNFEGLFWTTENILLPAKTSRGKDLQEQDRESLLRASLKPPVRAQDIFGPFTFPIACDQTEICSWRMREHPEKPAYKSRWTGRIHLIALDRTSKIMAEFDFSQLTRRHIHEAIGLTYFGDKWFHYGAADPELNMNPLSEKPATDIWWLWPMEAIVPAPRPAPWKRLIDNLSGAPDPTLHRRAPEPGLHARREGRRREIGGGGQIDRPDCCGCRCTHHDGKRSSRAQESHSDIFKEICKKNGELLLLGCIGIIIFVILVGFMAFVGKH